jgi:hypothetical protein
MALDQSALYEVLDALRNADAADRIKAAAEAIYQALIDAELTAVIGAVRTSAASREPISATDPARARSTTRPHCCGWPARCSLKPTTNGRSPTNAT